MGSVQHKKIILFTQCIPQKSMNWERAKSQHCFTQCYTNLQIWIWIYKKLTIPLCRSKFNLVNTDTSYQNQNNQMILKYITKLLVQYAYWHSFASLLASLCSKKKHKSLQTLWNNWTSRIKPLCDNMTISQSTEESVRRYRFLALTLISGWSSYWAASIQ